MTNEKPINTIVEKLQEKTEHFPCTEQRSAYQEKRLTQLFDLWWQADKAEGTLPQDQDFFPTTDIATQIKTAEKEKLIDPATAQALRDKFNESVTKAVGHELTDKQTKALYGIFRNFNLFDHS
jgi:hypothetical protein